MPIDRSNAINGVQYSAYQSSGYASGAAPAARLTQTQSSMNAATGNQRALNDVSELPTVLSYKGAAKKTHIVIQGEAAIFDPRSSKAPDGMYTFGAGPCLIMKLVSRDSKNEVNKIALAHNDEYVTKEAMFKLFDAMNSNRLEASFVSGASSAVDRAHNACEERGIPVTFSAPNPRLAREDALAVDKKGKSFYGDMDFSSYPKAMRDAGVRVCMSMRMPNMPVDSQLEIIKLT
ncbi:MAG: hypothetical protein CMD81_11600 [Gammaproteobacteria bacterium]|nr:hypothetical protein [Gammaproteobacteria bacterium]HBF08725.1 hypothetical protein [Gammaproteobacteria bacterium]